MGLIHTRYGLRAHINYVCFFIYIYIYMVICTEITKIVDSLDLNKIKTIAFLFKASKEGIKCVCVHCACHINYCFSLKLSFYK